MGATPISDNNFSYLRSKRHAPKAGVTGSYPVGRAIFPLGVFRSHGQHFVRCERIGAGFDPAPFIIEVSQIVVQEADQPDLVVDLANAHGLAGESGGEVDFAQADADTSAAGDAGLADRPRTPRHSPQAKSSAVVRKILYLRQNYHFGAGRIVAYLQRFHQIVIARSIVHRILVKNEMGGYRPTRSTSRTANVGSATRRPSLATVCRWT